MPAAKEPSQSRALLLTEPCQRRECTINQKRENGCVTARWQQSQSNPQRRRQFCDIAGARSIYCSWDTPSKAVFNKVFWREGEYFRHSIETNRMVASTPNK